MGAKLNEKLDVNKEGRCSVNVTAIVRITLQDGCYHEDVGCGSGENIKGKANALDKVCLLFLVRLKRQLTI
jgi:recombination DNA repair RAD52 pathway protein